MVNVVCDLQDKNSVFLPFNLLLKFFQMWHFYFSRQVFLFPFAQGHIACCYFPWFQRPAGGNGDFLLLPVAVLLT